MEAEVPQEPQEQQEEAQQQPSLDPRQALELAAQAYGTTPDYLEGALRLQDENRRVAEEMRRRQRDLEIREAQLEALAKERQRYAPPEPTYDNFDPALRPVFDELKSMKQMFMEERRERAERERAQEDARRRGEELHNHFSEVMRRVPSQNQMDAGRFFGAMAELWPDGPPPGITPERAVGITAKYIGLSPSGGAPLGAMNGYAQAQRASVNPRASVVIPMGPSGESAQSGSDISPRRPNESLEQYELRIRRAVEELGIKGLPDGAKVSSY